MHSTFPNTRAEIQILAKMSLERQGLLLGCWNTAIECLLWGLTGPAASGDALLCLMNSPYLPQLIMEQFKMKIFRWNTLWWLLFFLKATFLEARFGCLKQVSFFGCVDNAVVPSESLGWQHVCIGSLFSLVTKSLLKSLLLSPVNPLLLQISYFSKEIISGRKY